MIIDKMIKNSRDYQQKTIDLHKKINNTIIKFKGNFYIQWI